MIVCWAQSCAWSESASSRVANRTKVRQFATEPRGAAVLLFPGGSVAVSMVATHRRPRMLKAAR